MGTELWHAGAYGLAVLLTCLMASRVGASAGLLLAAPFLATLCGLSFAAASKAFSLGFGAATTEPGFAVFAAALLGAVAASGNAAARFERHPRKARFGTVAAAGLGLLAGIGASPATALAFCMRLALLLGGRRAVLALAAAANAAHGLLLPAPPLMAATIILQAPWKLVLALGFPLALCIAAVSAAAAFQARPAGPAHPGQGTLPAAADDFTASFSDPPAQQSDPSLAPDRQAAGVIAASLPVLLVLALLVLRALGDLPSEPLGGGSAREALIGAGRPLTLCLAALTLAVLLTGRQGVTAGLNGRVETAARHAAPLLLGLGLAGGVQAIGSETRMAENLAEYFAAHGAGLAVPALMAATFRALQAAPLTGAIATAGILLLALGPLGLDSPSGHAFAALAVGAGSLSLINLNDPVFWIVSSGARLTAGRALLWVTLGSAMQGGLTLIALYGVKAVWPWR